MAKGQKFSDQFKIKVVLEALRGDKTIQEIAAEHQEHPNQIRLGKRHAIEAMTDVFARGSKAERPTEGENGLAVPEDADDIDTRLHLAEEGHLGQTVVTRSIPQGAGFGLFLAERVSHGGRCLDRSNF